MAIDISSESLVPLNEVRFPLPKQPGPQTRWRLAMKGKQLPNGERVTLETVKVLGTRMTSEPAVLRFIKACNPIEQPVFTESQRRGQHDAATACLQAAGVLG